MVGTWQDLPHPDFKQLHLWFNSFKMLTASAQIARWVTLQRAKGTGLKSPIGMNMPQICGQNQAFRY